MSIGSWLLNHPKILEIAYQGTDWFFEGIDPLLDRLGYRRIEPCILPPEKIAKRLVFDCRMCGQCILHSTGMTCPMTCPKEMRNGPCGGVRENGNCEVRPDMKCVWMEAFQRAQKMPRYGEELQLLQPPVNWQLEDRSAWITMLTEEDLEVPRGWEGVSELTVLGKESDCWF